MTDQIKFLSGWRYGEVLLFGEETEVEPGHYEAPFDTEWRLLPPGSPEQPVEIVSGWLFGEPRPDK